MNELDTLTRLATLGTARSPELGATSGVEDPVLRALEGVPLEKRLLLAAGVRAVARAARTLRILARAARPRVAPGPPRAP